MISNADQRVSEENGWRYDPVDFPPTDEWAKLVGELRKAEAQRAAEAEAMRRVSRTGEAVVRLGVRAQEALAQLRRLRDTMSGADAEVRKWTREWDAAMARGLEALPRGIEGPSEGLPRMDEEPAGLPEIGDLRPGRRFA